MTNLQEAFRTAMTSDATKDEARFPRRLHRPRRLGTGRARKQRQATIPVARPLR